MAYMASTARASHGGFGLVVGIAPASRHRCAFAARDSFPVGVVVVAAGMTVGVALDVALVAPAAVGQHALLPLPEGVHR